MKFKTSTGLRVIHFNFEGTPAELGKLMDKINKLGVTIKWTATQLKKHIKVKINIKFPLKDSQKIREFLRSV